MHVLYGLLVQRRAAGGRARGPLLGGKSPGVRRDVAPDMLYADLAELSGRVLTLQNPVFAGRADQNAHRALETPSQYFHMIETGRRDQL